VRVLLDTHALLWAVSRVSALPPRVRALLEDGGTEAFVSAASTWEIGIKARLGKLEVDLDELLSEMRALGFAELKVSFAHARRASALPPAHRDPFDRMLAAQALEDGLTLLTRDPAFGSYAAPTLWA
jgi:PIN domain nuclease of toxin-antitoxin system